MAHLTLGDFCHHLGLDLSKLDFSRHVRHRPADRFVFDDVMGHGYMETRPLTKPTKCGDG